MFFSFSGIFYESANYCPCSPIIIEIAILINIFGHVMNDLPLYVMWTDSLHCLLGGYFDSTF